MLSALSVEGVNVIRHPAVVFYPIGNSTPGRNERSKETVREESFAEIMSSEGCDNFVNYIEGLGFINDPNTIILSSKHHYYYDPEELINVNTIINLKELNQIKQIRNFLNSVSNTLQQSCNFIGFFIENNNHLGFKSNRISSDFKGMEFLSTNPFLRVVYNIMDSRINKYMSKENVRQLLEEYRFKVLNMTDLNGVTYFHAQVA